MSYFAAMTLPALVVLLVVAAAIEAALVRRRRRRGEPAPRQHVAQVGFDTLGLALAPSTKHKLEHDEYMELKRDEEGDSAPPRSHVDLDAGVARLVVPSTARSGAARPRDDA
jgi:flagellar biosynthesis/type III secretory pathway M-ring protein FliF/YscJ